MVIIDPNKNNYIYGAGKYANNFYWLMSKLNKAELIKGFVVTKKDNKNTSNVYELSDIELDTDNTSFYLAVSDKYRKEICENLYSRGWTNDNVIFIDNKYLMGTEDAIREICNEIPIDNNRILFNSFDGEGYGCNCKYIAEYIRIHMPKMKMGWCIKNIDDNSLPNEITPIQVNTKEFYYEKYTAGTIVSNTTFDNFVNKREGQIYICSWHGMGPSKKVGLDAKNVEDYDALRTRLNKIFGVVDIAVAGSDFCDKVYRESHLYRGEILHVGYPRNDIFFADNILEIKNKVKRKYHISENQKIVLYAPTFRHYLIHGDPEIMTSVYDLDAERVISALKESFSFEYVFMYRMHNIISNSKSIKNKYRNYIDATDYPDMQELLVAADVLISDWSSCMWDFSLQGKPIFQFYNDLEKTENDVGFYVSPELYPYPKGHNTNELCEAIENFDEKIYKKRVEKWLSEYGSYDIGEAAKKVAELIYNSKE
ncbi:CDP-glycerol glycerophosphotransferase family protein [Pseudobutyrivibrio sp.]|uniref:CDP-glycerol glycerophosphotransferase family protein n=1 Tax=Pseudobutyrivibrio sp. TaxID=2014367 RepID=UPI001D741DE3|nr:CDP-glycerol glycerophosphotransferase family protein [Pseudobutyrivibrio sp.]MBE5910637.1 hypothetical protein [Pseudobutyrivibrio sp.]